MLVATRPPVLRDSFDFSDPVTFAEGQFIVLRSVVTTELTRVRRYHQRESIVRTRIMQPQ
jgi:hypothetical protein